MPTARRSRAYFGYMYSRRILTIAAVAIVAACEGSSSPLPTSAADSEAVLRAILEYRLTIEDSLVLDRRLFRVDTGGFFSPPWPDHHLLPASPLLAEVAADFDNVSFGPMRRTQIDTGWVMTLSHPVILGDRAVAYWVNTEYEPPSRQGYGYWSLFFRAELSRTAGGWGVGRVYNIGVEN